MDDIRSTVDTNIVVYAFTDDERRATLAQQCLRDADFVSIQMLNEFANVMRRKYDRRWPEIRRYVDDMRMTIPEVVQLTSDHNGDALRIAERYKQSFYDALMLAVALSGGARIFYSEDMQHDFVIDGVLRVVDPFRPGAFAS